jgi:hypothetical protein
LIVRADSQRQIRDWSESALAEALPKPKPHVLVSAFTVLLLISSLYSSMKYVTIFAPNFARPIIQNIRAGAAKLPAGSAVTDAPVSSAAVWSMVYPYTLPSKVLRPLGLKVNYLRPGASTSNLVVLDDLGTFRRAAVNGLNVDPGPRADCGWRIESKPVKVTLPVKTIVPWDWVVRIGYIATDDADGEVTAGQTTAQIHVHRGLGVVFLLVEGTVDSVQFGGLTNGAAICTNDIQVGTALAIPGSTP